MPGKAYMSQTAVHKLLQSPRLPTIPGVASQVLELTSRDEVDLPAVADVIVHDQALTSKILRTVNAPFYGLSSRCVSIQQALAYLGINTVKTLVLGFTLIDEFNDDDGPGNGFDYRAYWTRALYTAAAARYLATRTSIEHAEHAFVAGVMQDLGMLVMYRTYGADYLETLDRCADDHLSLAEHEQPAFDLDHAQAGAAITSTWNLPDALVDAIGYHHDADAAPAEHSELVRVAALGGWSAQALLGRDTDRAIELLAANCHQWFGMSTEATQELLPAIAEHAQHLADLLHINTTCAGEIDALLSRAEEQLLAHQLQMHLRADELEHSNEVLAHQALTDPLTGVGNRKQFDQQLASHFKTARSSQQPLALILVDIDHFKKINDTHGHQVGDAVLVDLAGWLTGQIDTRGQVCRCGGEEFAVILPGMGRVEATRVAEQLRNHVERQRTDVTEVDASIGELSITLSVGVAALEKGLASVLTRPEHLVRITDKALYAAKYAGRNCVRVFNAQSLPSRAA